MKTAPMQPLSDQLRGNSGEGLRLGEWWPRLVQAAWLALLLFVLAILGFRVQSMFQQVHAICTAPNCLGTEMTHEQVRFLRALGLPAETFAVYTASIFAVSLAVYTAVAFVLIWRRSWDGMAVFTAFLLLIFGGITVAANQGLVIPSALQLPSNILGLMASLSMMLFFYLFPNGRFVLRWPLVLTLPFDVLQIGEYFAPGSVIDIDHVPPLLSIAAWIGALGPAVYVQVYRYRRVSSPAQRQQTKWLVYGFTTGLLGFFMMLVLASNDAIAASPLFLFIGPLGFFGFLTVIPLTIGFALLRYRLWDVDVLINRTLVYGLLSVSLAGVYIGGVILLQSLFRLVMGQGSGLAVALSTLAIAALFQPLRRGVQIAIDRRFYRHKYDAARTLSTFSTHLRDRVDLDGVSEEIVTVVQETMQPAHVSLWLLPSGGR